MKKIIVYGSLKKGKYNHRILEDSKFLADTTVRGTLYSLGAYPALIDEGENEYPAEIYEVDDEVYYSIARMEFWAGYIAVEFNVAKELGEGFSNPATIFYAGGGLKKRCKESLTEIKSY